MMAVLGKYCMLARDRFSYGKQVMFLLKTGNESMERTLDRTGLQVCNILGWNPWRKDLYG
jgi:hypothetical protein